VRGGWDVARAVDLFGERNVDEQLFAWAAEQGRVFATCDKRIHATARKAIEQGRSFRMVYWWLECHRWMTDGDMIAAFEELARKPDAFRYPIEYIKPKA
jgi:hypothetical protein